MDRAAQNVLHAEAGGGIIIFIALCCVAMEIIRFLYDYGISIESALSKLAALFCNECCINLDLFATLIRMKLKYFT